jgi:adenylate cyclase
MVGLLLTAIVWQLFVLDPAPLRRLDLLASDLRFRTRDPKRPGPEVVIAAIDEKSIDQLGRWPWPYTVQATLVDRLTEYGAAVIGYDVVFSSSDTSVVIENIRELRKRVATSLAPSTDLKRAARPGPEADPAASSSAPATESNPFLERAVVEVHHDKIFADALKRSGRTVLGYFFHWDERDIQHLTPEERRRFWENIRGSEHLDVVLPRGMELQDLPLREAKAVEANIAILSKAVCKGDACSSGFFNSLPEPQDGVIRRYPLIVRTPELESRYKIGGVKPNRRYRAPVYPPLAIRVLEHYLQGPPARVKGGPEGLYSMLMLDAKDNKYEIPTDRQGMMLINYLGPSELQSPEPRQGDTSSGHRFRFPRYSVVDIVEGRQGAAPPHAFDGKIVFIGATATALADRRITPVDLQFPGVETHATVVDNILRQNFLVEPVWGSLYAVGSIVLIGLFLTLLLPRLGARWIGVNAGLLFVGSIALNYFLFVAYGWWLSMVYPMLATVVVSGGMTLYRYVVEEKDKRFLRKTFGTYLSPALIERMVQSKTEPKLGGESGLKTAYFTDIASFSSFSEVLSATKLVELLNEYLSAMTDILLAEDGTLDKYEGDAILAFFGAPIPMEDHAARALRTALKMQQALARLREKWTAEGDKWPDLVQQMRMRIGISSGEFVTGNMGSTTRMDYTMMGDVVNTAARIEASAKQYGIYLQCTTDTLTLAGSDAFEWRTIDSVRVVGKTEPVHTVEIMAFKGQLSEDQMLMREIYHQGVELYRQQKWDEAKAKFTESDSLEDMFPRRPTNPSRVYFERCDFFKANPPGEAWDGVWTLESK